ncbi:unnamed protein product [Leptidea sinapis]|uniref:Uncharacterized protein n=1 Tax=Leptidea sinapis TaxID=189913 RepID=A0A5E4QG01_9NEOP|nr:unnamed protein product [Leptidea sinapis]
MQLFFDQMKIEMAKQTKEIISQIDEKLVPFTREIEQLKSENKYLKDKICSLERGNRANNLIIYGLKEIEQSSSELVKNLKEKISSDLDISLNLKDFNLARRIGNPNSKNKKERPVLVSFVNNWQKRDILKDKKKLKDIHISEDYPKEVLDKRRELHPKLLEERNNGNYAVLNYDKLIVNKNSSIINDPVEYGSNRCDICVIKHLDSEIDIERMQLECCKHGPQEVIEVGVAVVRVGSNTETGVVGRTVPRASQIPTDDWHFFIVNHPV